MQHAVELLAILMLMAVGQCVVYPSANLLRRVLTSFAWSVLVFGSAILVISIPALAVTAVQLAGVLLAIYILRWIIGGIVEHFHGPLLFNMLGTTDVAAAAAGVTGASFKEARRAARRVLRRNEGYVALAALLALGPEDAQNLERAWQVACDKTRDEIIAMARSLNGAKAPDRVSTAGIQFLAQALCLYERESLRRLRGCRLASRSGREQALKLLEEQAQRNSRAELLGIPSPTGEESAATPALRLTTLLWPALGFQRLGFRKHALVISISQAILILYGIGSVVAGHGFTGNSGYVFLGVALMVHVQALLAMGDFADAAHPACAEMAGGTQ